MSEFLFVAAGAPPAIEAAPSGIRPHRLFGGPGGGGGTGADPHFVGLDGQRYDVMGEPNRFYNVLSTPRLQLNVHFLAVGTAGFTIIDQCGIKVPGTGIYLDLAIEGNRPVVLCNHGRVVGSKEIDPGLAGFKGGILVMERRTLLHLADYVVEVAYCTDHGAPHPRYGKLDRAHLDVYVHPAGMIDELRPKDPPHGLLGVTARGPYTPAEGGLQGEGVLDVLEPGSTYKDYEVSSLWADDFQFNQYRG